MDLKLKSLKSQLELCNDKLSVLDYVYYMYDKYLDNSIKQYVSLKHTLIELDINKLIAEIDEVYKEMEAHILDRIDIIQEDIDRLQREEEECYENIRSLMTLVMIRFYDKNKRTNLTGDTYSPLSNRTILEKEIDTVNKDLEISNMKLKQLYNL
jgi:hypothetical protein